MHVGRCLPNPATVTAAVFITRLSSVRCRSFYLVDVSVQLARIRHLQTSLPLLSLFLRFWQRLRTLFLDLQSNVVYLVRKRSRFTDKVRNVTSSSSSVSECRSHVFANPGSRSEVCQSLPFFLMHAFSEQFFAIKRTPRRCSVRGFL